VGAAIDRFGGREGAIGGHGVERVEGRVDRVDAPEHVAADLHRRAIARADRLAELADGHHRTRGTLNRPASRAASGALASAASRSRHGMVWSGRSAAWRVTTLAVGGTPAGAVCCP